MTEELRDMLRFAVIGRILSGALHVPTRWRIQGGTCILRQTEMCHSYGCFFFSQEILKCGSRGFVVVVVFLFKKKILSFSFVKRSVLRRALYKCFGNNNNNNNNTWVQFFN